MSSKKQKRIAPEAESGSHHTFRMELFVKNFKLLNIFT